MLEDFITLTEMKNGITTLPRIEELINTMQQQKNCSINNISDATRQRTKVISTIAATENEDCLKLFVKLKGLTYFNQWVQDVLEFSNDNAESIIKDFLTVLLESLEKLTVTREDSAASEMQLISEKLARLDNPNIKERARILFERCTPALEIDAGLQSLSNNENSKYPDFDAFGNGKLSLSYNENYKYANFDAVDNGKPIASDTDNVNDSQPDKTTNLSTKSSKEDSAANAVVQNTDALPSNSSQENLSVTPGYANEESKDALFCKDGINVDMKQGIPSEPDQESSKVQPPSKLSVTPVVHITEQSVPCNFDDKEQNSDAMKSATSPPKSAMQRLLSNGSKQKSDDDDDSKETSSENMEEVETGSSSEVEVGSSEAQVGSSEPPEDKSTPRVDHNSDYGLEYGEIDALEVARQVAIEVEREVVDYREPFCNSSPDHSSREDNEKADDKCKADLEESSKKQEATGESQTNKNKCVFDLNEDIFIDEPEPDSMVNLDFNKPAVPVSSTPHKTLVIEKTSSNLKRKAKCIEFDLNVVDHECNPEDLIEVSSKKPQKLKLDLNQLGEEETTQPQVQSIPFWSTASSSSSKQPKARGFDLNNNLNFFDVMGSSKKPEITIMGLKITGRMEDQASKPLFESAPNTVSPYSHQFPVHQFPVHASGFNGNMMVNSMAFPMPQYTYGNTMPCMIDSRGTPVVPQIFSNVGLNATATATTQSVIPPYHFLSSSNVAGTSNSGIDVNSIEGGSINFFMQERNGMTEEQGSMSRKESHSGRELYNFMSSWQ